MPKDGLDTLIGKESCPVCGTISAKGTARCPECGTFHSGVYLEERDAPPPEDRPSERDVDPLDYSIDPASAITHEEFESDDASVKSWKGGSTDFSFEDDEPVTKVNDTKIPDDEEILSD
ncbi:MAG: hypothetical protein QGI21_03055 [Candidatus Poseidoniaceae archaeon]|jgi:hypothetical protein|nr:hypothetical protein [Candidatus Poseidoniaceae archaeon]